MPRAPRWTISAAARRANRMRKRFGGGRPKVLRACQRCGAMLGAREMRQHKHAA